MIFEESCDTEDWSIQIRDARYEKFEPIPITDN